MSEVAQSCDRYILNTIIELIIENPSDFKTGLGLSVTRSVKEQIKKLEKVISPEVRESFVKHYGGVENPQTVNPAPPKRG